MWRSCIRKKNIFKYKRMLIEKTKPELIIEAAILEFQEKGFERASMDRITELAGVSKRTVYNHFESKSVLFKAIIEVMASRLKAGSEVVFQPDLPIREQLFELGQVKGKFLRSKQFMQFIRMAMSETLRDPAMAHTLQEKSENTEIYTKFFEAAVASGKLKAKDPKKIEDQFIGLIKAQAFWPAIFSGNVLKKSEFDQVLEESVDTIMAAYAR